MISEVDIRDWEDNPYIIVDIEHLNTLEKENSEMKELLRNLGIKYPQQVAALLKG